MNIIYRPAKKGEGKAIARYIISAWPVEDMVATVPGMTVADMEAAVADLIEEEGNMYSWDHNIVAVDADLDKIIGVMTAYDGADYAHYKIRALERMHMGPDSPYSHVVESDASEFYLDSVGVDSAYRGHGIASRLFQEHIDRAVALGYKRIGLIVDIDKPKAEALYTRLGFKVVGTRDFMGHLMKHMVYEA